jgi:hypothetical protein
LYSKREVVGYSNQPLSLHTPTNLFESHAPRLVYPAEIPASFFYFALRYNIAPLSPQTNFVLNREHGASLRVRGACR